ncbi:MAG TPA: hypothetical protein VGR35_22385 [Tepidisphaeraceae bacterium]|nr:hypothetical protein [Tepidisphaeraceae bacterium]
MILLGVLVLGTTLFFAVGIPLWNAIETGRAAQTDTPPILISDADLEFVAYPDAVHIVLRDGRVFRLAHVLAPDPGTPEHERARQRLQQAMQWGANRQRGLKPVGTSGGEVLVELWSFSTPMGGCGNMTWSERRRAKIPHWKPMTWQLVSAGDFALAPGVMDAEAVGFDRYARENGEGLWSDPRYLRTFADLAHYESVLTTAKEKHTIWQHRTAARILLRTDPEKYASKLLALVKDRSKDVHFRNFLALALDEEGLTEATDYLMDVLRGRVDAGLDEHALNSVVGNYITYWELAGQVDDGDEAGMVAYYDATVRPKRR